MNASPLSGIGVLITRPAPMGEPLAYRIEALGGLPILLPTIELESTINSETTAERLNHAAEYHQIILISRNAVRFAKPALDRIRQTQVAAVGGGTARALAEAGITALTPRDRFDSEGLLALPELTRVAGQRILIIRGNGGRELLAATLRTRGAQVDYAEVYRRTLPSYPASRLDLPWNQLHILTTTSREILNNLVKLLGPERLPHVLDKPLVVVSEPSIAQAREQGFRRIVLAEGANDHNMVETIIATGRLV
jgi:uroporphyrinogen-III synthase